MKTKTIRVDERTFAVLQALAECRQKTITQIVSELVDRQETDRLWREMREGYARLQADPIAWQAYLDEARGFKDASLAGLEREPPYYSPEEVAEIEQHAKSRGW